MNTKPKIAVIGDVMLNIDHFGNANRVCNEGAALVLASTNKRLVYPGGAAGVAMMCWHLGAEVQLFGHFPGLRADEFRSRCAPILLHLCGTEASPDRQQQQGAIKHRYYDIRSGVPHLMMRFDEDCGSYATIEFVRESVDKITEWAPDAIIVSDHGKGTVYQTWTNLRDRLPQIPIFVDPVKSTPLFHDAIWCGSYEELPRSPASLGEDCFAQLVVTKSGRGGFMAIGPHKGCEFSASALCEQPRKTIGAGDQLIAALAVARARGLNWQDALRHANVAAALQCESFDMSHGITPITQDDITRAMSRWY